MTTSVIVNAHCSESVAVEVIVTEGNTETKTTLNDGESIEVYAYDRKIVTVQEVHKPVVETE